MSRPAGTLDPTTVQPAVAPTFGLPNSCTLRYCEILQPPLALLNADGKAVPSVRSGDVEWRIDHDHEFQFPMRAAPRHLAPRQPVA